MSAGRTAAAESKVREMGAVSYRRPAFQQHLLRFLFLAAIRRNPLLGDQNNPLDIALELLYSWPRCEAALLSRSLSSPPSLLCTGPPGSRLDRAVAEAAPGTSSL